MASMSDRRRSRAAWLVAIVTALACSVVLPPSVARAAFNEGGGAMAGTLTYDPGYEPGAINDPYCETTQWELDGAIAQANVAIDGNGYVGPASVFVQGASYCGNILSEEGFLVELDITGFAVGVVSTFQCQYLGGSYTISDGQFSLTANGDCNIDGADQPNETVTITGTIAPTGAFSTGAYTDAVAGAMTFGG